MDREQAVAVAARVILKVPKLTPFELMARETLQLVPVDVLPHRQVVLRAVAV
jgi:hypothetical protein